MDLARTQFFSIFTKAITTVLGIVQSIIVIRLLSKGEFGLVGLVMSIGGLIGVSQHLGIVDGAIREIAILKTRREVGKVYWVSHLARQAVTIPLSLLLVAIAGWIAVGYYHRPEIIPYIRLFAAVLILQGLQDVMGATLTGMRKFAALYVIQIITAAINIAAFGYLTWRYGITGFFWAIIATTALMVTLFGFVIARNLRGNLSLPSRADIREYGRRVMKVGAFMYASRILFVVWQRLPLLVLGGVLTSEQLGELNVSLTFGSKLTILAAALSEVNLAWMSSLFSSAKDEFRRVVEHNMQRVFLLMTGLTMGLLFFTPEILQYVIGPEYLPAQPLILLMTVAFFLYAVTDIGTSSLFVSADETRIRTVLYLAMTVISGSLTALLLLTRPNPVEAAAAVLVGIILAYIGMVFFAKRRFNIAFLTPQLLVFLLALLTSMFWLFGNPALGIRLVVFIALAAYILWTSYQHKLLPRPVLSLIARAWPKVNREERRFICFAGAIFDQPAWTNRQHMTSRISQRFPILYVEPRLWIMTLLKKNWQQGTLISLLKRLLWYEKKHNQLFIKAQWNLIPGSREFKLVSLFNHWLNRLSVLLVAQLLGFRGRQTVLWLYDTEAAEFLSVFSQVFVLYDCVDDHAVQAGTNRNPQRVHEEEHAIMQRVNLVTVTSKRLYQMKAGQAKRVEIVLNAGDVRAFLSPPVDSGAADKLAKLTHPILGTVGALDAYKLDVELLVAVAQQQPHWQFVFVGSPVVDGKSDELAALRALPNIHFISMVPHEQVPSFVRYFDLCLIPYRDNEYNRASFPLKFWEFMATGKPIVASGVPELKEYGDLIGYATSASDFIRVCEEQLAQPQRGRKERVTLAKQHSWEKRVERVLQLIV